MLAQQLAIVSFIIIFHQSVFSDLRALFSILQSLSVSVCLPEYRPTNGQSLLVVASAGAGARRFSCSVGQARFLSLPLSPSLAVRNLQPVVHVNNVQLQAVTFFSRAAPIEGK